VIACADGLSAFRLEARLRVLGDRTAQACWSQGCGWHLVQWGSVWRPDPVVPVRARGWREAWARRGRKWAAFRRRRV
jgi:hypothetical protein